MDVEAAAKDPPDVFDASEGGDADEPEPGDEEGAADAR